MICKNYPPFLIRKANKSDCHDIFKWRNDPETRNNSILGKRKVSFEEHMKWFNSKIKNPNSKIYIVMLEKNKVGILRSEISKDFVEIGINVNPEFRQRGIGTKIAKLGTDKIFKETGKPVIARTKSSNKASIEIFSRAGYALKRRVKGVSLLCFPAGK